MLPKRITKPSTAEQARQMYGKNLKMFKPADLQPEAIELFCKIRLAPTVKSSDLEKLKADIENVLGVEDIVLLVDYVAEAVVDLPENHTEYAMVEVNIRLRDNTPVEP